MTKIGPLVNPDLTTATDKLASLRGELHATEAEATAIMGEIDSTRAGARLTAEQRAELLLAGTPAPTPPRVAELEQRYADLRAHVRVLEEAVRLSSGKVVDLRIRLTRKALPMLREVRDQYMRRMLAGALELFRARKELAEWRAETEALGWAVTACGELNGHHCHAPALPSLIEACERGGIITAAEAARLLAEVAPTTWRPEAPSTPTPSVAQIALEQGAQLGINVTLSGGRR